MDLVEDVDGANEEVETEKVTCPVDPPITEDEGLLDVVFVDELLLVAVVCEVADCVTWLDARVALANGFDIVVANRAALNIPLLAGHPDNPGEHGFTEQHPLNPLEQA